MGLGDLTPTEGGSSSNSSSSSSDSDSFPHYKRRCPELLVRKTDDGYEVEEYPHTPAVEFKKDWFTAPWEKADLPKEDWVRAWWDKSRFQKHCRMVKEEFDIDLRQMLDEDPERAINYLVEAARSYGVQDPPNKRTRTCAVCGDELHIIHDDTEHVGNRIVCDSHNVKELAEAGLLD